MKKFVFAIIAVALIVMNVLAFSSAALPPSPYPPGFHDSGCYQTVGYCGRFYGKVCTTLQTNQQCREFYCSTCPQHDEPSIAVDDDLPLLPKYNF